MGDNLNPQQFKHLYHEAPVGVRESIRAQGIRPSKPFTPSIGDDVYPHGVYLNPPSSSEYGSSMHDAPHYGYDRWRVNVEGLDIGKDPDPLHPNSFFTPEGIPAERLTLAKKAHPNWEKHI